MEESVSDKEVQSYVRMILPLMTKHNIPIIPKNYDVWYRYVSGVDSELNKAVDDILKNGKHFTEEINEMLYPFYQAKISVM
jgi:diguanylate cyclase